MFPSTASALQAHARETGRLINLAQQIFALTSVPPICLFGPSCPCQREFAALVDEGYRNLLVLEFGRWQQ